MCCVVLAASIYMYSHLFAGSLLGAGCLLYPLGWDTADVTEACGPTAHIYQPGVDTIETIY